MESTPSSLSCTPSSLSCTPAHDIGPGKGEEDRAALSNVDSFLVEALENPRHRLTVLRMELEIQQFMQSTDQYQFEFQPFPTSYLRCAAHRVAQHYGLQTMSVDNITDGFGSRIAVRKTPESRYPPICLSDIPLKQHEDEKTGQIKIFVRRPSKASLCNGLESGNMSLMRTVEERMEEYDKARARIFSCSSGPAAVRNVPYSGGDEKETSWNTTQEPEKMITKDATSRIAIFRDREKDKSDPDYDRSYGRYVSGFPPCRNFTTGASSVRQPSPMIYDGGFSLLSFRPQVLPTFSTFGTVGCSPGAVYVQWPTPATVYSQSYEQFRNAVFQAPVYQQPLSFDHLQNS